MLVPLRNRAVPVHHIGLAIQLGIAYVFAREFLGVVDPDLVPSTKLTKTPACLIPMGLNAKNRGSRFHAGPKPVGPGSR